MTTRTRSLATRALTTTPQLNKSLAASIAGGLSLTTLTALTLTTTTLAATAQTPAPKPNIILILADDMGYGDIGPYGSVKNRTPHLDRMAAEGMKLTSFYAAPLCTASRAQFMTGCYVKRLSLPMVLLPVQPIGLNPNEHTVASLLKKQGYATMVIGKWHLGDQAPFLPLQHGFDHYLGLPYSNDMNGGGPKNNPPLPLIRDDKPIEVITPEKQDHLMERYTAAAIQFIRQHAQKTPTTPDPTLASDIPHSAIHNPHSPFFLYFAHTAVHKPLHPGPDFAGKSPHGPYSDWVEELDHSVGRVLDTLRELHLAENTLVIYTSDNGPYQLKPDLGGVAGPLRGAKGSTYEGGLRVPTLAWWPGHIAPGTATAAITAGIDILPTFVHLAGGTVPTDNKIDGADITPILLGQAAESTRKTHYYFSGDHLQAIRTGPWKLAITQQEERTGAPSKKNKNPRSTAPRLYNLDTDIGERHDIAARHPDIVKQLQTLAAAMDNDLGTTAPGPGVRPPGRVAHPVGLWLPGQAPTQQTLAAHYDLGDDNQP